MNVVGENERKKGGGEFLWEIQERIFSSIFFRHSFIAPGQIFPIHVKGNVVCGT